MGLAETIFLGNHHAIADGNHIFPGKAMTAPTPLFSSRVQSFFPLLIVAAALIALSVFGDALVTVYPFHGDDIQWRFATFLGLLTMAPQLTLIVVILAAVAVVGALRGALRGTAVFAFACAAMLILIMPFFALDFLTVRRLVPEANKRHADYQMLKAVVAGGVFAVMLLWMGWRGWQLSAKAPTGVRAPGEGLVVGQG
jgi:hypothetical protein